MLTLILSLLCGIIVLVSDQLTKAYISANFALLESKNLIPGILDITYVHNRGGAWGLLNGYTWLLISVTIIIMVVCLALLLTRGRKNKLFFWSIMLILSGGIGNLIDRIFRGGVVVDFLHLHFMPEFPVFNIADCAIVIGACLLILNLIIEIHKENIEKNSVLKRDINTDENN